MPINLVKLMQKEMQNGKAELESSARTGREVCSTEEQAVGSEGSNRSGSAGGGDRKEEIRSEQDGFDEHQGKEEIMVQRVRGQEIKLPKPGSKPTGMKGAKPLPKGTRKGY